MKKKLSGFLLLFIVSFILGVSCKKIILSVIADSLMYAFDLWEDRPEGIPCNQGLSNATFANQEIAFDHNHMLCVNIEMDANDFKSMREESRFGPNIYDNEGNTACAVLVEYVDQCDVPFPNEYNWYSGNIVLDGVSLGNIGIRKKGFLGSIFSPAPSLRIITDKYIAGQDLGGTSSITFNNNSQEVTRIWTSLAYYIYELANYPAPRSHLANVSINDEALGVYTRIEPLDEKFLQRVFGNSAGHLYEGQVVDFVEDWLPRWTAKTAATNNVGLPIINIAQALELPDEQLISTLEQYLNIDRFISFWALEILLSMDDGYTVNRNNFFVYFDPDDGGRATLIPWGIDYYNKEGSDLIRFMNAELPRRLSRIPIMSAKLQIELQRLLNDVWDENFLISFIDNYSVLVETAQIDPGYSLKVDELRSWVANRRNQIEYQLLFDIPIGAEYSTGKCYNE